ncbi:MAG: transposase [Bacteroidetes bacterium]|nr:transposase [Bacteroidota bacterium]
MALASYQGQSLSEHPHLHTMVPAGGWSEWNGYWKNSRKILHSRQSVVQDVRGST